MCVKLMFRIATVANTIFMHCPLLFTVARTDV